MFAPENLHLSHMLPGTEKHPQDMDWWVRKTRGGIKWEKLWASPTPSHCYPQEVRLGARVGVEVFLANVGAVYVSVDLRGGDV